MNIRMIAAVCFTGFLLCGCSTWDDAMSSVGLRDAEDAAPSAAAPTTTQTAPPAQASTPDDWCRQIGKAAGEEAAGEGFDLATQQKRAESTYRQCIAPAGAASR